jgi:hypothetical protein
MMSVGAFTSTLDPGASMSIIRVIKDDRRQFIVTDIEIYKRNDITWEAKALHTYLMSKPEDWDVRIAELIASGTAKKDKIQKMLKDLKEAGYVNREQFNDPKTGKFITITNVYERVDLNPQHTPTYGGTGVTVTENPATDRDGFTVDGKPPRIVSIEDNYIYKGNPLNQFEWDDAYEEFPFETVNSMVSTLSGICKGFVNIFEPQKCDFYRTAIMLLKKGITEEQVCAFGDWWQKFGHYEGKPAVKSLLLELDNFVAGVQPAPSRKNYAAERSWTECWFWLKREIKIEDFKDPLTIPVIRKIGESNLRTVNQDNHVAFRRKFIDYYENLQAEQNGA